MSDVIRMKSLVEISQIVTGSENFFSIKDKVVEKMLEVVHPTKACVNLFFNKDYNYSHLVCSATLNYIPKLFPQNEQYGSKIDFALYPKYIHEAVNEKKVVIVKNIFEDERAEGEAQMALGEKYIGRIVIPFIYNDETIGFMTAYLTEEDEVSQDDVDFMIQVASLMSLSISTTEKNNEISMLVNKLRTSISNINKGITALYSTQDIYSYLNRITRTVVETTQSENGFLGIYKTDDKGNILGQNLGIAYPQDMINKMLSLMPAIIRKKHIFEICNDDGMCIDSNEVNKNHMFIKIDIDQNSRLILYCSGDKDYGEDDKNTISILSKQIKHSINTYDYYLAEEKQKKMEEDLSIIGRQQELIMNNNNNFTEFSNDSIFIYHKPSRIVGGDFYTAIEINDEIIFILGDVMGHGIVSNYIVAMIKGAFEVLARHYRNPSKILKMLNSYLYDELDALNIFFTAVVGVINKGKKSFRISNAGHYFPIIVLNDGSIKNDNNRELERGISVGIQQNSQYKDIEYCLEDIKQVCFFTDGILEMKNSDENEFGEEGFSQLIIDSVELDKQDTIKVIDRSIRTYSKDMNKLDDILILIIKNEF